MDSFETELLEHLQAVEREVVALPEADSFGFGLLCAERLLSAYVAMASGQAWNKPPLLRDVLDGGWRHLLGHEPLPPDIGRPCLAAAPPEQSLADVRSTQGFHISHALHDLLVSAQEGNYRYSSFTAARPLEALESLESEPGFDVTILRGLMRLEMKRQQAELSQLKAGVDHDSLLDLAAQARRVEPFAGLGFANTP